MNFRMRYNIALWMLAMTVTAELRADDPEFTENAQQTESDLGVHNGVHFRVTQQLEHQMGDNYNVRLTVSWTQGKQFGETVLFDGITCGDVPIRRVGSTLFLTFWGNRYDSEGYYLEISYVWNPAVHEFIETKHREVDPWQQRRKKLVRLLENGQLDRAFQLAAEMTSSPNGGHTYETQELFELFVLGIYPHAVQACKKERKQQAASWVKRLLFMPLFDGWHEFNLDTPHFSVWPNDANNAEERDEYSEPYFYLETTPRNIRIMNDYAWVLMQGREYEAAKTILTQVLEAAPERKAAWLNLADASYETRVFPWDEETIAAYETYANLMTNDGRAASIPKRVQARIQAMRALGSKRGKEADTVPMQQETLSENN